MLTLTVWKFDSPSGAEAGAFVVDLLASNGAVELYDAATAVWEDGWDAPRTRRTGGTSDGTLLDLVFGIVFRVPLVGAAMGAPPSNRSGALSPLGIGERFVNRVRDRVTPGTSALFLVSDGAAEAGLADALDVGPFSEPIRASVDVDGGDAFSPASAG